MTNGIVFLVVIQHFANFSIVCLCEDRQVFDHLRGRDEAHNKETIEVMNAGYDCLPYLHSGTYINAGSRLIMVRIHFIIATKTILDHTS